MYTYVYICLHICLREHTCTRLAIAMFSSPQLSCDIREDFYCFEPLSSVAIVALAYRFFLSLSLFQHLFHL